MERSAPLGSAEGRPDTVEAAYILLPASPALCCASLREPDAAAAPQIDCRRQLERGRPRLILLVCAGQSRRADRP